MVLFQVPDVDDALTPLVHRTVEVVSTSRGLPQPPCEIDGEGQRINLVLALPQLIEQINIVGVEMCSGRTRVKGVGVGVDSDAVPLPSDDVPDLTGHRRQVAQCQEGPQLSGGVAQPHGRNVASDDEDAVVVAGHGASPRVRHPGHESARSLPARCLINVFTDTRTDLSTDLVQAPLQGGRQLARRHR